MRLVCKIRSFGLFGNLLDWLGTKWLMCLSAVWIKIFIACCTHWSALSILVVTMLVLLVETLKLVPITVKCIQIWHRVSIRYLRSFNNMNSHDWLCTLALINWTWLIFKCFTAIFGTPHDNYTIFIDIFDPMSDIITFLIKIVDDLHSNALILYRCEFWSDRVIFTIVAIDFLHNFIVVVTCIACEKWRCIFVDIILIIGYHRALNTRHLRVNTLSKWSIRFVMILAKITLRIDYDRRFFVKIINHLNSANTRRFTCKLRPLLILLFRKSLLITIFQFHHFY